MIDTVIVIVIVAIVQIAVLQGIYIRRRRHSAPLEKQSSLITPRCWGAQKETLGAVFSSNSASRASRGGALREHDFPSKPMPQMTFYLRTPSLIPSLFTTGDQCRDILNDSSVESLRLVIAHKTSSDTGTVPSHNYGGPSISVGLRKEKAWQYLPSSKLISLITTMILMLPQ
jgi:hypothetical protein